MTLSRSNLSNQVFSRNFWLRWGLPLIAIVMLGLFFRLFPGNDHFIWTYDQARDRYVSAAIIEQRDIMIVGPQTEYVGLSHGPLYYYLIAPWYTLSNGDPNLPGLFMIGLNLSALIPLCLLAWSLFRSRSAVLLSALLFVVAYQQVEYARWLSNVSIVIPFTLWLYFTLWQTITNRRFAVFTGLFLGLCIQGQLYFLFFIPVLLLMYYLYKVPIKHALLSATGLTLGLSTFIIAELRFGFLATQTFIQDFLSRHSSEFVYATDNLTVYLNHLGLSFQQNIFGISAPMGLWGLILVLGLYGMLWKKFSSSERKSLVFLGILIGAHSVLFTFHTIDLIFVDLPLIVILPLVTAPLLITTWKQWKLLTIAALSLILITQAQQLLANTRSNAPFQLYHFIQNNVLWSEKLEVVEKIADLTKGEEYTLSVLGTPYGVQTVWASAYEQMIRRSGILRPTWLGFAATGYPADSFFEKVDHPGEKHVLIIEPRIDVLNSPHINEQFIADQDRVTTVQEEIKLHGYRIQLRTPKSDLNK